MNTFFVLGNLSEVGGFTKTLHNFLGWSDENLTLPYKGRYIVKKMGKDPYIIKERSLSLFTMTKNDKSRWTSQN